MKKAEKIYLSNLIINTDNYEILRILGDGGYSTVYEARDKNTGEHVALKVIKITDNMFAEKKTLQTFMREVIAPCILSHPGVVHLLGFRFPLSDYELEILPKATSDPFSSDEIHADLSGPIIVTELIKNSSLEKLINGYLQNKPKKGFGPTQISKIIFGVAANMAHIHKQGIVHRDLKQENTFLDENFEPRIADFGLAKIFSNLKNTIGNGTPIYMAPELLDGEGDYDASVDVYAFAILLYKLFENKTIFSDGFEYKFPSQVFKVITGIRLVKTDKIPDVYWDLIQMCWSQKPRDRPSFKDITKMLRDDKYAVKGLGKETDLEELHAYQKRITMIIDEEKLTSDFNKSMCMIKNMSTFDPVNISPHFVAEKPSNKPGKTNRKNVFSWHRH